MGALGLRATPRGFHWAVVDGTSDRPVKLAEGGEASPKAFEEAERLAWVRTRLLDILAEFELDRVGVRLPEPTARGGNKNPAKERCRVEGVLMEACASQKLPVLTGALKTLSGKLGTNSAKSYLVTSELRGLKWSDLKTETREAVLAAASTLE